MIYWVCENNLLCMGNKWVRIWLVESQDLSEIAPNEKVLDGNWHLRWNSREQLLRFDCFQFHIVWSLSTVKDVMQVKMDINSTNLGFGLHVFSLCFSQDTHYLPNKLSLQQLHLKVLLHKTTNPRQDVRIINYPYYYIYYVLTRPLIVSPEKLLLSPWAQQHRRQIRRDLPESSFASLRPTAAATGRGFAALYILKSLIKFSLHFIWWLGLGVGPSVGPSVGMLHGMSPCILQFRYPHRKKFPDDVITTKRNLFAAAVGRLASGLLLCGNSGGGFPLRLAKFF